MTGQTKMVTNTVTANDQGNLENIGAGTYTAVVTDENGCSDTVTVEITENEPVAVSEDTLIMLDMVSVVKMKPMGLLILLLPAELKYIHMTGQTQDGNAVTANDQDLENIGAGTYTAVVTDENGCS